MARKRAAAAVAPPGGLGGGWIDIVGYDLTVQNSMQTFIFRLDAWDMAGGRYHLFVNNTNQSVWLVQKIFCLLGTRWPAYQFQLQADGGGSITDVR